MEDIMTVQEFADSKAHNKFWLCPSAVSSGKISRPLYLSGIECTRSTIPDEIKDKKVRTSFPDSEFICIIWENDEEDAVVVDW